MHFFALYAETHFRFFRFFPSLLHRPWPEVIFDMPRRISPHEDLCVALIVNDLASYPADISDVKIAVGSSGVPPVLFSFSNPADREIRHPLSANSRSFVFSIPREKIGPGGHFVNATAVVSRKGKSEKVLNDNLPGSTKAPLSCFVSDEPFPGSGRCVYGDLHVHSHYSQSHVEFGPPVEVIARVARAAGIDFVAITDHSYDLACTPGDYLRMDPDVQRWGLLQSEIAGQPANPVILSGEEISCANARDRIVHLLGIGTSSFIPGSRDGARRGALHSQTLSASAAVKEIHRQGGIALAAHPGNRFGRLQRIVFRRGGWDPPDLSNGIDAVQAVNSGFGVSWERARRMWVRELLRGRRLSLVAGNDAHGDFNRYRCIRTPFVSMYESSGRYFSHVKTGIYGKRTNATEIIEGLRSGATFVTNGPFLSLRNPDSPIIGRQSVRMGDLPMHVIVESTPEFGSVVRLRVIYGRVGNEHERIILGKSFSGTDGYSISESIAADDLHGQGYIRADAVCRKQDGSLTEAFTSPCYFE